ncbi:PP0621 family protein [Sulfurimonas sp.]|uniref:PP0621 family protein n=1 Tax=Sulfurimonas sp. TaxID=2022749 RepID=UPI0025CD4A37|nr:PP0621 family protein [Sulfurimonas sp.]MDD5158037.1 PP0621 family protein [Sulfurimonas sp.]
MILKYLLIIGVFVAIYFYLFKKKPITHTQSKERDNDAKKDKTKSSDMVECATCGIYCELDDAILSVNKYYCSSECLKNAK